MHNCGKRSYSTEELAIEALIGAHTHFDFNKATGPITVYKCDDCGDFHLTSTGTIHEKLSKYLKEGKIDQQKEADYWERKLRR